MICASIRAATNEEAAASLKQAGRSGADLAELRLDHLQNPDLEGLLKDRPLPVIATARPKWEGGAFEGSETERIGLLESACLHGADWVDVEYRAFKDFKRRQAKLILSFHDFERAPADLESTVTKMRLMEPDLMKVAVTAQGAADLAKVVKLQKESRTPSAFIAMGPWGESLRILYRKYGGFVTYAPLEAGRETAPGQVTVSELIKRYRLNALDDETRVFGIVGNPVAHSKSPVIFNRVFRELGLKACYVRLPVDDASCLRELLDVMEVEGASVTLPHKQAVFEALDEIEPAAQEIGAVNTIARKNGKLLGSNTDVRGALEAIGDAAVGKWNHGVYGLRVLVLGAGGVARALAWGLKSEGAQVTITNRTWEKAQTLADQLGCSAQPVGEVVRVQPQVIVNATSVGMAPNESEMPPVGELLGKDMLVVDSVYTPRQTRLIQAAREKGAATVDGVDFFLRQANHQFQTWFGRKFPTEVLKEFYRTL